VAVRYWTCTRRHSGYRCGHRNERKYRYCRSCGKPRPAHVGRKSNATRIDETYAQYVARVGETCGICGRRAGEPGVTGKPIVLVRDHEHRTGRVRGLLCQYDNRKLGAHLSLAWARAVVAYLERYE
jgi:hypothetical protein